MAVTSDQTVELLGAVRTKLYAAGSLQLQDLANDAELNQIVVGADTGGEAVISEFCVSRLGKEFQRLPGSNILLRNRSVSEQFQGTSKF